MKIDLPLSNFRIAFDHMTGCSFDACGYGQSDQIMQAATLPAKNKNPSRDEIVEHMNGNICRCGTYLKIISAIQRAAREG